MLSIGQTRLLNQSCTGTSSAAPRNSTIGLWVCPLTSPGVAISPVPSRISVPIGTGAPVGVIAVIKWPVTWMSWPASTVHSPPAGTFSTSQPRITNRCVSGVLTVVKVGARSALHNVGWAIPPAIHRAGGPEPPAVPTSAERPRPVIDLSRRAVLLAAAAVPLAVAGCASTTIPTPERLSTNGSQVPTASCAPTGTGPVKAVAGVRSARAVGGRSTSTTITGPGPHHITYGTADSQWGELYLPTGPRRPGVAVIIHGGFWLSEYGADLGAPIALDMSGRGYAAWNLEYRRIGDGGGWPQTFQDVAAGIDHLSVLAVDAGLDLSRVVVIGHSAGGQLAVWAAGRGAVTDADRHSASKVPVTGVVSQAGVLDLAAAARSDVGNGAEQKLLGGDPDAVPSRYQIASPVQNLPIRVPVRCVHSRADGNVPYSQSADYVSAAVIAGGDATLTSVPGDHFSLITIGTPAWEACAAHAVALLRA